MIKFELFTLQCMASNINWQAKTITINDNIKYILTSLKHYTKTKNCILKDEAKNDESKNDESKNDESKNDESIDIIYSYSEITNYWTNNIIKYSQMYNIDFTRFKLKTDYSIAPIYIIKKCIYVGIFIINLEMLKVSTSGPLLK